MNLSSVRTVCSPFAAVGRKGSNGCTVSGKSLNKVSNAKAGFHSALCSAMYPKHKVAAAVMCSCDTSEYKKEKV